MLFADQPVHRGANLAGAGRGWAHRRAASARELATLKGYDRLTKAVIFSLDGRLLATAGADGAVRLWATATLRQVGEMNGGIPIVFSPDGRALVASDSDRTLTIRTVANAVRP